MSLPAIRDAIVDALKTAGLGDHVEAHAGKMSIDQLRNVTKRGASSVHVACIGIPRIEQTDTGPKIETHWAAYIIALDGQDARRDVTAMIVAAAVACKVPGNVWDRDDLESPQAIRADNLFSGKIDKKGLALWAVSWRHDWTPENDAGALDDLLQVVATWDIDRTTDGEPQPVDTINLEGGN